MTKEILTTDTPEASENTLKRPVYFGSLNTFFMEMAKISQFTWLILRNLFKRPFEFKEILNQCYNIGVKSLPLIGITGFIMGLVFTVQSRPTLARFGAESWLPAMIAVTLIREIAPVITALIFAGKVGSGIGAELASMRVTEQIDAMEVSGRKPFKYLVVTRMIATTLMLPLLATFADAISILGSFIGCNIDGDVGFHLFFSQAFAKLDFIDIWPAFIKTIFFGFTIGLVACYKGYNSGNGTEGVGKSANSAVVIGSLLVFIIDMIAVQISLLFT